MISSWAFHSKSLSQNLQSKFLSCFLRALLLRCLHITLKKFKGLKIQNNCSYIVVSWAWVEIIHPLIQSKDQTPKGIWLRHELSLEKCLWQNVVGYNFFKDILLEKPILSVTSTILWNFNERQAVNHTWITKRNLFSNVFF